MAQFLGDIAFALWTFLLAGGLIAWRVGSKEAAGLIKTAAAIMIVVGIGGAARTGYFWFTYSSAGAFESAYPARIGMGAMVDSPMRQMPMGRMGDEGMQGRPMMSPPAESRDTLSPEQQELLKDPNKHPM